MNHVCIYFMLCLLLCFSCTKKTQQVESSPQSSVVKDTLAAESLPVDLQTQENLLEEPDSSDAGVFKVEGTYIYISKPKMRLYVLDKADSLLFTCGIACGIRKGDKQEEGDYRTPEGRFKVTGIYESTDWIHKTRDGREVKGCYGPFFIRLYNGRHSGIGIHGTNAPRSIGLRASEGCIRVNSENIKIIKAKYAYSGMPVFVSGERERLPEFITREAVEESIRANEEAKAAEQQRIADSLAHVRLDSLSQSDSLEAIEKPLHTHPQDTLFE